MCKEIISSIIGKLKQDDHFPVWWRSAGIEIPFFDNKKLPIVFMDFEPEHDSTFIAQADLALSGFLDLKTRDRVAISSLVVKNRADFVEATGYDETQDQLTDPENIWNLVYPQEVYLARRSRRDQDIYVMIACECEWEQEHGLQLVFRQGKKITRVSDQDGHLTEADAYGKTDEEDELLSKFGE